MSGRFAHLKDPKLEFMNQHREMIVGLCKQLLSEGVLGKKEWHIRESDLEVRLHNFPYEIHTSIILWSSDQADYLIVTASTNGKAQSWDCLGNEDYVATGLENAVLLISGSTEFKETDYSRGVRELETEQDKQRRQARILEQEQQRIQAEQIMMQRQEERWASWLSLRADELIERLNKLDWSNKLERRFHGYSGFCMTLWFYQSKQHEFVLKVFQGSSLTVIARIEGPVLYQSSTWEVPNIVSLEDTIKKAFES